MRRAHQELPIRISAANPNAKAATVMGIMTP